MVFDSHNTNRASIRLVSSTRSWNQSQRPDSINSWSSLKSESEQLEWRHLFYRGAAKSSNKKNILRTCPLVRNFPFKVAANFLDLLLPCPSFLGFLEKGKETTKKTRIFYSHRTPKIPGKEKKKRSKKQGIPRRGKKQGIPKKQGKEGQGGAFIEKVSPFTPT